MADELAKVLTIPDSVTQKMDDVIEKINEIESASNKMADTVNAAWKSLANGEIDNYLKKLQDVANATSSKKISIDTTDITKAASEAERWATAMAEVATQASNYAASKTATFAVQQEWNEALKALKSYEEAKFKALEQGTTVSPQTEASHNALVQRLEELRAMYPNLARAKDAAWDATQEKLYVQHLERIEKKNQQIEDKEERQAHSRALRAKQVEAANTRILILAEKLSREEGKSQHYAGLIAELQRLQEEYKKLGNSKEDAERRGQLEKEMEQVRASIQSADGAMRRLSNTTRGLFNYSEQLGRAFALLFSVSQIRGYIRQIREVTAEFELQRVALGSLLQSQDKANELFGQITNLAVRSPFTIKELNTYTKQLAAYNIQYENLFDTTKMLADVSAGLGVDIGRLILAFGQVKAATVLRGTEVRQFTEAGFGILGELAKYYTELEGKLVSVGDVQDRITKKMVKFADVEEIFKRVTSAGGMFYNMQEKMANTLYGKWSNLTDRIDLMLNEIGQNNMGILNLLVDVSAGLADNWEAVATALQLAIPALISFKVQSTMAAKGLTWIGEQSIFATTSVKGLSTAFKSALGPVGLLLIALEAGYAIFNHLADTIERNNEAIKDYNRNVATLTKTQQAFADIEKMERKANETDKDFAKRQYDAKLASLISLREELAKIGFNEENLPDISLVTSDNIDQQINDLQKAGKAYVDFSHKFRDVIGNMANGVEWLGVLGENVKSDAEDLVRSASKMNASVSVDVENIKNSLLSAKDQIDPDTFNKLFEGLTQGEGQDIVSYAKQVRDIVSEIGKVGSPIKDALGSDAIFVQRWASSVQTTINGFMFDVLEMEREADKFTNKLIKNYYGSRERMQEDAQSNPIAFVTAIRDELARQQIDGFAQDVMAKKIVIDLIPNFDWSNMSGTPQLTQWKKDLLAMPSLKGLISKKDLENIASFDEYVSSLQSETKKAKEENERYGNIIKDNNGEAAKQFKEAQDNNTKTIKANEAIAKALGINLDLTKKEQKQAKTRNDYLRESVSLIEKMGKEYDDALDSMGKTAAKTDISTRYSSLLSDLADKAGMDGTAFVANLSFDTSGIISALQKVADAAAKAGAAEAEQAAREAIAKIQGEDIKIEVKANVDKLESSIDNVIAKYNLGKELSKLKLGDTLTEQLFGVQPMNISDLRKWLEEQKKLHTDSNGEMAKEYVNVFADAEKKITELQNKETEDRVKKYASYLKKSVSERVRIEQEAAKKIAEVEAESKFTSAQKATIRSNIQKETQEALDKLSWSDFKASGMYLDLFENLEQASKGAIDNMLNELEQLRSSLNNLPPDQLKEIIAQIEKLSEIKIEKSGIGDWIKNIKEGIKSAKQLPELEEKLLSARNDEKAAKTRNNNLQKTRDFLQEQYELAVKTYGKESKEAQLAKNRLGIAESNLILSNEDLANKSKTTQELEKQVGFAKLQKKLAQSSIFEMLDSVSATGDAISNLHGALTDVFGELPTVLEDAFIYAEGLFAGVGDIEKGLGEIMSGKFISGGINTLVGAFRTIGGIFGIGLRDVRRERDIERELALIEDLQKSYEKLEEAIDAAYSSRDYDNNYRDAIDNLDAQNAALRRAMAAEEDKKNTDAERIKEWEEQEQENLKKIAQLRAEAIESYGGFGTSDNLKSAAEDFVSAWMDAFNETGKGLDGLSEKMDEWLNNAIQRQLLMRLSDQYITPLLDQFDDMFEQTSDMGRIMTKEEIDAWKKLYEENSKAFDEKAQAYLDALGIKPTGIESEMSGLQRGIEGVTETTAQALEALLNSMRFYVSDSNNLLRQFYMSFISADETMNPMLYELKQHTTLLNAIHTLLNSTTKMTNNNGRALKVLMM